MSMHDNGRVRLEYHPGAPAVEDAMRAIDALVKMAQEDGYEAILFKSVRETCFPETHEGVTTLFIMLWAARRGVEICQYAENRAGGKWRVLNLSGNFYPEESRIY